MPTLPNPPPLLIDHLQHDWSTFFSKTKPPRLKCDFTLSRSVATGLFTVPSLNGGQVYLRILIQTFIPPLYIEATRNEGSWADPRLVIHVVDFSYFLYFGTPSPELPLSYQHLGLKGSLY